MSWTSFKWLPGSIVGTKTTATSQALLMSFTSTPMPKSLGTSNECDSDAQQQCNVLVVPASHWMIILIIHEKTWLFFIDFSWYLVAWCYLATTLPKPSIITRLCVRSCVLPKALRRWSWLDSFVSTGSAFIWPSSNFQDLSGQIAENGREMWQVQCLCQHAEFSGMLSNVHPEPKRPRDLS